jgi:hypothetical protein
MKVKELIEKLLELPEDFEVQVTDQGCCGCSACEAGELDVNNEDKTVFIL